MLFGAEILRSIPLPIVSLSAENKDIANGSVRKAMANTWRILPKYGGISWSGTECKDLMTGGWWGGPSEAIDFVGRG